MNTREHVSAVLAAWNNASDDKRIDLMTNHPDLYEALVWLDAHETVRRELPQLIRRSARR